MGDKAVVVAGDDMGDALQCNDHPYQNSPGGICAFCLQDRLGKLVSSSNTDPFFPPTSSAAPLAASDTTLKTGSTSDGGSRGRASKIPFLSAAGVHRRNKKGGVGYSPYNRRAAAVASSSTTTTTTTTSSSSNSSSGFVFKRSKSVNPRPLGGLAETGSSTDDRSSATDSPRKKSSFWSFLHLSSAAGSKGKSRSAAAAGADLKSGEGKAIASEEAAVESPGGSQASSSFGRKVSRSRSVGCGSRSFSGDFLERISTGFADCTLRRVESQREVKCKAVAAGDDERRIKERVKCGGLFGGFGMLSSSSSYWISAAAAADREFDKGRSSVAGRGGRSRSWGWAAFASPMRAFKPAASSSTKPLVNTTVGGGPTSVVTTTAAGGAGGAPTTVGNGVASSDSKIGPN